MKQLQLLLALLPTNLLANSDYFRLEDPTDHLRITDQEICDGSDCYPRYFQATKEWQVIKPGQYVPKGLHIRIDYNTQLKEAKLLDNSSRAPEDKAVIVTHENPDYMEPNLNHIDSKVVINNQPETIYKRPLNRNEQNTLHEILSEMQTADSETIVRRLQMLTERAYDIDVGYSFTSGEQGRALVKFLNHDDIEVKEQCALLLGACVGNNPGVITNLIDLGMIDTAYELIGDKEGSDSLDKHCIHILAAMARGNDDAFSKFMDLQPLPKLLELKDARTLGKLYTMFEDLMPKFTADQTLLITSTARFEGLGESK